jgi:FixJ family two-component response regulator
VFFVSLASRRTKVAMGTKDSPSGRNQLIVIVDDDPAVGHSLKFSLEIEGYAVNSYSDGRTALGAGDIPTCACLVVDQNMPGMTGLDVVDQLRARQILVPVVLITSHPTAAVRERAQRAGVRIVEKPFHGDALLEGIRAATLAS